MANKQPSNKEANIRSYYSEVNKFAQNSEYDKAIKSLNKSKLALKTGPNNCSSYHTPNMYILLAT